MRWKSSTLDDLERDLGY